eukprot:12523322-Alexandrium_andersonii.AAC.1
MCIRDRFNPDEEVFDDDDEAVGDPAVIEGERAPEPAPAELADPGQPSAQEIARHRLTHLPFQ